ncbi:lipid II flippase MurJ [Actinomycetaceae bacterium MB13-C1-2]|nr:lipid II flippase MurJ [Actinomycetaceae bacterium MB13-C1-2]
MSSDEDLPEDAPLEPKKMSLWRSSALMASGTLVSRALGFIRSAMLISVIGVAGGVAVAFPLANTLPNMVYNLLAGGVLDAVLVPQIVKALRSRSGSPYVNKLITAVGSLLFLLTVVAMIGAPLLISLMASKLDPATRSLAITFTLLCLPQIFFYGVYNLFGQILNARGVFGPYMWVPVVNNIIAIASLGTFIAIWGTANEIVPVDTFTTTKTLLLCGSATLGVALQAIILIIPIRRSGVKLKLDFRLKGTSFGSAPKVAMWTFATLLVGQIGVISATNLATRADDWVGATNELVAGYNAYQTAYMMYMLPQSLITVTLVTAIFTRLANHAAEKNMDAVATNFYRGVQLVLMLTMLATAILMVAATPLMQLLMPTFNMDAASLYGAVLVALALGVPSSGMTMMGQRIFYVLEDARPVFMMGIAPLITELVVGWGIYFVTSAQWWTIGAAGAETVSRILQGFLACYMVSRAVPEIRLDRLMRMYGKYFVSFIGAGLVGWGVLHLFGAGAPAGAGGIARMWGAGWRVVVIAIVISIVYFAILRVIDPAGFNSLLSQVTGRFPALSRFEARKGSGSDHLEEPVSESAPDEGSNAETTAAPDTFEEELSSEARALAQGSMAEPGDAIFEESPSFEPESINPPPPPPPPRHWSVRPEWTDEPPTWDQIFDGESVAVAFGRAGAAHDPAATTGALPVLTDAMMSMTRTDADSKRDNGRLGEARVESESTKVRPYRPSVAPPPPTGNRRTMEQRMDSIPSPNSRYPEEVLMSVGETDRRGRRRGRFDPTIPALLIGLAIVIGAIWFAFSHFLPDSGRLPVTNGQSQQSQLEPGQSGAAPVFSDADLTGAPPVITSVSVLSWNDDGNDHANLTAAVIDGDPETFWPSRYFDPDSYAQKDPVILVLNLQEPAVVSKVGVSVIGTGGEVTILNTSGEYQRQGRVLASAPLSWDTVITLDEPTAVTSIGLVFNKLPIDDEARYRAKVISVSVE